MIIAQHTLEHHLKKGCAPVYLLTGQEPYLFNQAVTQIKQAWARLTQNLSEETILTLQHPQDWTQSLQDANTYSLFAEYRLLDLRFAKKSIDALGKQEIQTYLNHPNPRCLILIQAPELPAKQIQALTSHPQIVSVQVAPYSPQVFKKFIVQRLQTLHIKTESDVPDLVYQYHQANLLACSQFLDLLACMHDLTQTLTVSILMTYLRDQSEFSIYELGDACLSAKPTHAMHVLRQIQHAQGEPILILWVFSQELRKLIQLHHLVPAMSWQAACQQLKIWSQKTALYQAAWQRISLSQAYAMLIRCQTLDEQLKSNRSGLIWQELERLVMTLST